MKGAAAATALRLAAFGSAAAASWWFLSVAVGGGFAWWWPSAVLAAALLLTIAGGPCGEAGPLWRSRDSLPVAAAAGLAVVVGRLTVLPGREWQAAFGWLGFLAAVAWIGVGRPRPEERSTGDGSASVLWGRLTIGSMLAVSGAGLAAWLGRTDGRQDAALGVWLASLAVALACSLGSRTGPSPGRRPDRPPVAVELGVLLAVVVVAVLLRFVGLDEVPVDVDGDEGRIGLHIVDTIGGLNEPFFDFGWNAFAQVAFFAQGMWMKALGPSLETLRLGSATAGTVGVLLLYLFLRETCGWRAAAIGALLLAVNPEHIAWSRCGLMNVQAVGAVTLAMAALAAALRRGGLLWWSLLGAALAGCFLTYHAAKAAVGVVVLAVGLEALAGGRRVRSLALGGAVALVVLVVTLLPWQPAVAARWSWYSEQIANRFDVHLLVEAAHQGDDQGVRDHLSRHVGGVVAAPVVCRQAGFVRPGGLLDRLTAVWLVGAPLWLLIWWRCRCSRLVLCWIAVYAVASGMLTFDPPWKPRLVMALPAVVAAVAMVVDLSGRVGGSARTRWPALLPWGLAGLCVVGGLAESWRRHVEPFLPELVSSNPKSSLIRVLRDLEAQGWIPDHPVVLLGATNRHEANLYHSQRHGLLAVVDGVDDAGDDLAALPFADDPAVDRMVIVAPHQRALLSVLQAWYPGAEPRRVPGQRGETMFTLIRLDRGLVEASRGLRRLDGGGSGVGGARPAFELDPGSLGRWAGGIHLPPADRVGIRLVGCDSAAFDLDGSLWHGESLWVDATAGWHDLEVGAAAPAAGCTAELHWATAEGASWTPIPPWALRPERGVAGLVLRAWRGAARLEETADRAPDLWRVDPVLSYDFDTVERRYALPEPLHEGRWLAHWDGRLVVPPGPPRSVELEFDTAWAELEIGDSSIRAEQPSVVTLAGIGPGEHRLSIRVGVDASPPLERLVVKLAWTDSNHEVLPVPYGALLPAVELMHRPAADRAGTASPGYNRAGVEKP